MKTKSKRLANIELLRILAMCMVIMLHYLGKGELLPMVSIHMGKTGFVAWIMESLSVVAVNVYVLISGYFLVDTEFKPGKILKLVSQVLFYTILVTILSVCFGLISLSELGFYNLIVQLFPFQLEQYWFMTAYLVLYLLSPLLAVGVKSLSEKSLRTVVILFVIFMSVEKTILPVEIAFDKKGYDALWFICLFLVAAYLKLYGIKILKNRCICVALYLGGCAMIFLENLLISVIWETRGELGHLLGSPYHYNHFFVLTASVGLFSWFLNLEIKEGFFTTLIRKVAPYTLGVYLLHEQIYVRYLWPKWLGADKISNIPELLVGTFLAVAVVFLSGVTVDYLRSLLWKAGSRLVHGRKIGKDIGQQNI